MFPHEDDPISESGETKRRSNESGAPNLRNCLAKLQSPRASRKGTETGGNRTVAWRSRQEVQICAAFGSRSERWADPAIKHIYIYIHMMQIDASIDIIHNII